MLQQFDDKSKFVKAVGFAFMSPEVILLFADHSRNYFHLYPPHKKTAVKIDLSDTNRKHIVLLRAADKLHELDDCADKIYRVVIFGKADDLLSLKIPIIDAEISDGKLVEPKQRQTKDVVMGRIEAEAADVSLDATISPQNIKKASRKMSTKPADRTTLRALLRSLRDSVKASAKPGVSFVDHFGTPTIFRLTGDISREEFKTVCKRMVTDGGIPEDQARSMYGWIEGFAGSGPDLAAAVEKYLHPGRKISDMDEYLAFLADEYKVDVDDICLVAEHYKAASKLLNDSKAAAKAPSVEVEDPSTSEPSASEPSDDVVDESAEFSDEFADDAVPDDLDVDPASSDFVDEPDSDEEADEGKDDFGGDFENFD